MQLIRIHQLCTLLVLNYHICQICDTMNVIQMNREIKRMAADHDKIKADVEVLKEDITKIKAKIEALEAKQQEPV